MIKALGNRGWIGRTLEGRYQILELLGEGGMGAVFKARHLVLDKEVALKVIHPGLAQDQELVARFAREVAVTSRLDHPNVISVSDSGVLEDGRAYIAMQLVRGPSLTEVLDKGGRIAWQRVAALGAQLADALAAARGHGIVHRDLKPDNILLQQLDGGRELVKLLDFGVARFVRESMAPPRLRAAGHNLTKTGLVVGTPGYMSPEQSLGEPADFRSDLYSVGVILWECLVGRRLWVGEDVPSIAEKQLTVDAPDVRLEVPEAGIPDAFAALVSQMLARRANDRPQDPALVKDVLLSLVGAEAVPVSFSTGTQLRSSRSPAPSSSGERVGAQVATLLEAASPDGPARRSMRARSLSPRARSLAWLGLLGATLVGAVAALAWLGVIEVRPTQQLDEVAEGLGVELPDALKVMTDAEREEERKTQARQQKAVDMGVPVSLLPEVTALMGGETRTDRVDAARALVSHMPIEEVEPYVRAVAQLQMAETCQMKAERLEGIRAMDDARSLPALHHLASRPRTGCGKKRNRDCIGCLRDDLDALIAELEAKQLAGNAE